MDARRETGKYIIGGGPTGLITWYYNQDYHIISPSLGEPGNKFFGPIYLRATPLVNVLLKEVLGEIPKTRIFRVGYADCFTGTITETVSPEIRAKYSAKTRGFVNMDYSMNHGLSSFEAYPKEVLADLLAKLSIRVMDSRMWVDGEVTRIERAEQNLVVGMWAKREPYKQLISTIPAPVFMRACDLDINFTAYPIYIYQSDKMALPPVFDFVYIWGENPIYRMTKEGERLVSLETLSRIIKPYLPLVAEIKYGKIVAGPKIPFQDSSLGPVRFVGRYARWDPKLMLNDVIVDAIKIKENPYVG